MINLHPAVLTESQLPQEEEEEEMQQLKNCKWLKLGCKSIKYYLFSLEENQILPSHQLTSTCLSY